MSDCPCGYSDGTRPTQIGCGAKVCPNRTESPDSLEVHVHKVIESMPWWARVFTQHEGETTT